MPWSWEIFLSLTHSTVMLLFLIIALMVRCSLVPESWNTSVLSPRSPKVYIPTEKTANVTGNYNLVVRDNQ